MHFPFWIGPNTALVLTILGMLAIYWEFLRPGRFYPGLLGAAILMTGGYFLAIRSPSRLSLVWISTAVVLFVIEAIWKTYFLAGILATISLAVGFSTMFREPPWIVPGFAIPVCAVFGAITMFLCYAARRARRNKWSDIGPQ